MHITLSIRLWLYTDILLVFSVGIQNVYMLLYFTNKLQYMLMIEISTLNIIYTSAQNDAVTRKGVFFIPWRSSAISTVVHPCLSPFGLFLTNGTFYIRSIDSN